jgi:hypothetical protein
VDIRLVENFALEGAAVDFRQPETGSREEAVHAKSKRFAICDVTW